MVQSHCGTCRAAGCCFVEKLHEGRVKDVAFSPDGSLMASGGDVIHLRRVAKPAAVLRNFATRLAPHR